MEKKNKGGRPAVKRSEELAKRIRGMAAVGVPADDIAKTVGFSTDTLTKLYAPEMKSAAIEATAQVAGKLYQQCMEGNTAAMIFWLKTRGRWSEKSEIEVTGKDGGAIQNITRIELVPMKK